MDSRAGGPGASPPLGLAAGSAVMLYSFGNYTLDAEHYELHLAERLVRLDPQAFNLLAYLVQHAGRTVTKEELEEQLWPDQQVVGRTSLAKAVAQARKALGDTNQAQRYIQTVHRRGYRFVAPVIARPLGVTDLQAARAPDTPRPPGASPLEQANPTASPTLELPKAPSSHPHTPVSHTPVHLVNKILTSRSALEGERKQITVLCASLTGAAELLANRDPEQAQQILEPCLERMLESVHRYEGTVHHISGDGMMALFGAPLAHEDHAARACYAALAMQKSVLQYAEELRGANGVEIQPRAGLNSGEVVVRAIGNDLQMDYAAVGHTTFLATQLEQLVPPGAVWLTGETLRSVEGCVRVKPLDPVRIAGLTAPVGVFELVGAESTRTRLQAAMDRVLTPFVGRQRELETLRQALEQAGAGHGQVVAVIGEPGVGKSRLFLEFTQAPHTKGWFTLEVGAASSYEKATPYLPIIGLLKAYFQVDGPDDGRGMHEQVTDKLLALDEALRPTLPAFFTLLDIPIEDPQWRALEPPQRRQRTLDAMKHLLLRESQVQPVLVIVENLHWIDTETQAFLDCLVESLPTARLLLLVNYRLEFQHGWGNKSYYRQIRLDPLPPARAVELLRALLGDDASLQPLKQRLIERTEGNPFFLEESIRTLAETKALAGDRGVYRLAQALPSIQMPATVQAVLAARIDRLPAAEKDLLQVAAVIGKDVPLPLLQILADGPDETLWGSLAHLQAVELLYETNLFPEIEYTFKHALTHEVAYGSLLQERRRILHARIMEAIERLYPDRLSERVDRLAYHALRGEVWGKALVYLRQGGAKAMAHSAYREAVACQEQALMTLRHVPENRDTCEQAIDLRIELRNSLAPLGELGRIHNYLCEAESLAKALNDPQRLWWVSTYLTNHFLTMGDYDRAIQYGQRTVTDAVALGTFAPEVTPNYYLARAFHALGDYRRAIEFLKRNVAFLEGKPLHERFGQAAPASVFSRTYLAWSLAEVGEFAGGITVGEEGIRIAEAVDHPYGRSAAYFALGLLYLRKGDFQKAIPLLEDGLEFCRSWNIPLRFPSIASTLGSAYVLAGRGAEGLPLLEQAVEQGASMSLLVYHSLWLVGLSWAYLMNGRVDEAMDLAVRAIEHSRNHKERGHQAYALRLLGEIVLHCDSPDINQGENSYRQALALAEELGMRPLVAHCRLSLAALFHRLGRLEQVRSELSAAIEMYCAMNMSFWLAQAEAVLAQVQ